MDFDQTSDETAIFFAVGKQMAALVEELTRQRAEIQQLRWGFHSKIVNSVIVQNLAVLRKCRAFFRQMGEGRTTKRTGA